MAQPPERDHPRATLHNSSAQSVVSAKEYSTCLDRPYVQQELRWAKQYNKQVIVVYEQEERRAGHFDFSKAMAKYKGTEWEYVLNVDAIPYRRDEEEADVMVNKIIMKAAGKPTPVAAETPLNEPGTWELFLSHAQATGGDLAQNTNLRLVAKGKRVWYDNAMRDRSTNAMEEGVKSSRCVLLFLTSTSSAEVTRMPRPAVAPISEAAALEATGEPRDGTWQDLDGLVACRLDGKRLQVSREDGSLENWNLVRELAECAYGTVWLGELLTSIHGTRTTTRSAVKQMSKARICAHKSTLYEDSVGEIEMLRLLGKDPSPSIVELIAVGQDEMHLYVFLEFVCSHPRRAEHLELLDYVQRQPHGRLAEVEARQIFAELLDALEHLHRRGIYHLDVSLENILIRDDGNARTIKLIDFGLALRNTSVDVDKGSELFRTISGTVLPSRTAGKLNYAAPEIVREEDFGGASADLWSAGVLLFAMLTGTFPYAHPDDDDSGFATLKNAPTDDPEVAWYPRGNVEGLLKLRHRSCSPAAQDLLSRMLIADAIDARLILRQVRQHAWVRGTVRVAEPDPSLLAVSKASQMGRQHLTPQQLEMEAIRAEVKALRNELGLTAVHEAISPPMVPRPSAASNAEIAATPSSDQEEEAALRTLATEKEERERAEADRGLFMGRNVSGELKDQLAAAKAMLAELRRDA